MFGLELELVNNSVCDLRELEYVAALHQTGRLLRKDGSIFDKDISRFFSSRYGIKITHDEVRLSLLKGFSGRKEDEGFIDLCELASALLIPFLLKANAAIYESPIHKLMVKKSVAPDVVRKYIGDGSSQAKDDPNTINSWEHKEFVRKCKLSTELTLRKSPKIISDVLTMMIHDSVGPVSSDHPPALEVRLLQRIFRTYGEVELSNDTNLLNEMIEVAAAGLGTVSSARAQDDGTQKPRLVLDTLTFIRALTSDVLLFDVDSELETTTNEHDVFNANLKAGGRFTSMYAEKIVDSISRRTAKTNCDNTDDLTLEEVEDPKSSNLKNSRPILKLFTSPGIDFFADTYRSKFLTCALWVGFLISYLSQIYFSASHAEQEAQSTYSTEVFLTTMRNWFFKGLTVGLVGLAYVGFGGLGNNMFVTSIMPSLAAIATIGGFLIKYYFWPNSDYSDPSEKQLRPVTYWVYTGTYYASFVIGFLIIFLHLVTLLRLAVLSCLKKKDRSSWFFSHPGVYDAARTKQAAAYKINRMVDNAHKVHQTFEKGQESEKLHGRALLNFGKSFIVKKGAKSQEIGPIWAWRQLFSGRIFYQEGIWLSSRAIAANVYQVVAIILLATWLTAWVIHQTTVEKAPRCTEELCQGNPCIGFCQDLASKVTTDTTSFYYLQYMKTCVELNCQCNGCGSVLPPISNNVMYIATSIGGFVALSTTLLIAFLYIPSYIITTLKYRSGVISSLKDDNFPDFRQAADNVTLLLGSAFWGLLATGAFFFFLVVIPVMLIADKNTRQQSLTFLTRIAGIFASLLIKVLFLCAVRRKYLGGFYRKYPAITNAIGLFIECWNIYLAAAHIIQRVVRLILASIFHIGRIDTPLLTEKGINPTTLDALPQIFRQDILVHEAHRHPYIDLLGKVFMYKLRYEERFVHTAGSAWRMLFTLALMPWLRKYRVFHRKLDDDDDGEDDTKTEGENKNILTGMNNSNFKKITYLKKEYAKVRESKADLEKELAQCKESYEEEIAALKEWIKHLEENTCVV
mmetsp:Transcript_15838/g.22648  ORF Transcript_15838/g.22648 Transcript_15838/m.22648 type:complete len:1024 (-) Transcript_15838:164-3235(-)|eukprot:CAMPEP_0172428346 /NCGR_PEP_ID=MMETSP1064-20121228/45987_1 /TAXON_ID=202472 /ORGANISM="Aulacoseira subarctica , Strain CCAP 1002/5" /LENGTH=1023 /DNA_ID=CAMNT_0013173085 /DNA_START=221 /DNA_END=3292 /DNA_ORIENTATION=-